MMPSTMQEPYFSSAFWGDWTRVEVRKIALECATRKYTALEPHEVIGVADLYAEWIETGEIASQPAHSGAGVQETVEVGDAVA